MPSIAASIRLALLSSALLSLVGCTHADPEGDANPKASPAAPDKSAVAEPAAESAPAAEAVVQEMTLDSGELTKLADGSVEYCLDCKRQSATYNYCEFDKAALESALGDEFGETVQVRVSMVVKNTTNDVPDDPNAPQPDGGFTRIHHSCTIDAVLPSE
jgi:hypothetical protein